MNNIINNVNLQQENFKGVEVKEVKETKDRGGAREVKDYRDDLNYNKQKQGVGITVPETKKLVKQTSDLPETKSKPIIPVSSNIGKQVSENKERKDKHSVSSGNQGFYKNNKSALNNKEKEKEKEENDIARQKK